MTQINRDGQLVRIFLSESDHLHNKPLFEAILYTAREMGMAGATVFRAIQGYGADSVVHSTRLLRLSVDLPIVVEVVEGQENVDRFIEKVQSMLDEANCGALITLERATVIRYQPEKK